MIALILSIIALGVGIAALIVALRKKDTLIESQSDSNCNSNEVQMGGNQTLNEEQVTNGSVPSDGYPFTYSNGTFKMDGNLEVTGGITCLK